MQNISKQKFDRDGFFIFKNFIPEDTAIELRRLAAGDTAMAQHAFEKKDKTGRTSRVTLWYEPGDDVFGRLSCSDLLLSEMSGLLEGAACFFHAKLMQKEPKTGGAWEWHQDYGYWYDDGFINDAMASCYVALDPATKENGCLQVIPGSHKYGRIRHESAGQQIGAERKRVSYLSDKLGIEHCELAAGDAVFFHCNLLHASAANQSCNSRWGLISSFFKFDNESILDDGRFKRKDIRPIEHDKILTGRTVSTKEKLFLTQ